MQKLNLGFQWKLISARVQSRILFLQAAYKERFLIIIQNKANFEAIFILENLFILIKNKIISLFYILLTIEQF